MNITITNKLKVKVTPLYVRVYLIFQTCVLVSTATENSISVDEEVSRSARVDKARGLHVFKQSMSLNAPLRPSSTHHDILVGTPITTSCPLVDARSIF